MTVAVGRFTYTRAAEVARELVASPWGAELVDLVSGGEGVRDALRYVLGVSLRSGDTMEKARAEIKANLAEVRTIVASFATADTSPAEQDERAVRVLADLSQGITGSLARQRLALFLSDREAFQRGEQERNATFEEAGRRDRLGKEQQLRTDPVFAARAADMFAQHAIDSTDPAQYHHAAVRRELERAGADDALAREAITRDELRDRFARRLMDRSREVARILGDTTLPTSTEEATRTEETSHGPVLWADARLAELVSTIGEAGRDVAEKILVKSAGRLRELRSQTTLPGAPEQWGTLWRLWLPPDGGWYEAGPLLLEYVALAVWEDEIRPALEYVRRPGMVPRPTHKQLRAVLRPGGYVEEDGPQLWLRDRDGGSWALTAYSDRGEVLLLPRELVAGLKKHGAKALASVQAQRFLVQGMRTAREQQAGGLQRPDDLVFPNRWRGVVEWLGIAVKGDNIDLVRNIVLGLSRLPMRLDYAGSHVTTTSLLSCTEFERGAGDGELIITLNGPLRSDFSARVLANGRDRNLVPLLDPPPPIGGNRAHASQVALLGEFVAVLDERRQDLATNGAARVPMRSLEGGATWKRLADRAGLREPTLPKVLDGWQEAEVLFKPAPDMWTLGKRYAAELEALTKGGEWSRRQRRRAEAGARMRANGIRPRRDRKGRRP